MENIDKERNIKEIIENDVDEKNNNNEIIILNESLDFINENDDIILKNILLFDDKKQNYLPILNKDCSKYIIKLFNYENLNKCKNKEDLFTYIKKIINIIHKMENIIGISYEIFQIIINFLEKNDISLIEYFIDLFFECVSSLHSETSIKDIVEKDLLNNGIFKEIKDIIYHLLCYGFLKKTNLDYVYQKISELQLKKELCDYMFYDFLDIIKLLYGNNYEKKRKEKLIAKNYLYFYNKEKSGITTNISNNNNIKINNGFSIILWFYLNENEEYKSILCETTINDRFKFEFILNEKNDIIIKCNNEI